MRFLSGGGLLAAAILAIVAAGILLPQRTSAQSADVTFRVTVTNATNPEMVITPGAILVHDTADAFWSEATAANLALERIAEIIDIAKQNGYTHIFAGYGFMAEDADFIEAIEASGVGFIGPSSSVIRRAGAVYHSEFTFRAVVLEDRSGLLIVDAEPAANRLRPVVRALNQLTAAVVAGAISGGR